MILIGCVGGTLYYQRNMWSGLTPAPTIETLTGTWTSSISGKGLTMWLPTALGSQGNWYYDVELRITQSGNTITGSITETLRSTQYAIPSELSGSLNVPYTYQITDGRIQSNQIQFKAGVIQFSGTFLTNSMKGTAQEDISQSVAPSGIERTDTGWVGTFNLYRGF